MKLPRIKNYPKSVRVKDEDYAVKMFKCKLDKEKTITLGDCNSTDKVIRIYTKQSATMILRTLIHELTHAMDDEYQIKLTHKQVYIL